MSDLPPPPGATPPPPPPPPGFQPSSGVGPVGPSGAVRLARVGGLAKALVIAVSVAGATAILTTIVGLSARDEAEAFLDGRATEDAFIDAYAPSALVSTAFTISSIATVILTFVWMQRVASNHRELQRRGTWGPGWAIGGWFLPPAVLYVIPFLMLREMWRASDPTVPVGSDEWKQRPVAPVVAVWWVLYGLVPLGLLIAQGMRAVGSGFTGDTRDLAETLDDPLTILSAVVSLTAAIAWALVVRGLTDRHRLLTGEAVAVA